MEWPRSAAGSDGCGGGGRWHGVGRERPQLPPHYSNDMVLGTQPGYLGATHLNSSRDSGSQCHELNRNPKTSGKGVKGTLTVAGRVAHCCDRVASVHWLERKTSVFIVHVKLKEVLADGTQGWGAGEPE